MWHQKCSPSVIFFSFKAICWKIFNNIEIWNFFEIWISCHFVLFLVTNGGKLNFQNAISFEWIGVFENFSLLTSLWWVLSETIIRYPIILKQNLAGTLWHQFPAKMPKSEKPKTHNFREWWVLYCCKILSELC